MSGAQAETAGLFFGADPDCSGAAYKGKGVVAYDLPGAFKFKADGVIGEGAYLAEFIVDP